MNITINEIKNLYKKSKNPIYNKKKCYDSKCFLHFDIITSKVYIT